MAKNIAVDTSGSGELFTAADITAATVYEMPSSTLCADPRRDPVFVVIDPGDGASGVAITCERRPDGSVLIIDVATSKRKIYQSID